MTFLDMVETLIFVRHWLSWKSCIIWSHV